MQELLLMSILIIASLVFQILVLRVLKDKLNLTNDDPRFRGMVQLIYVNLGIYLMLSGLLVFSLLKR